MKLAFIGASHWHLPLYLNPALEIDGVRVVGVSRPGASFVKTLAAKLGCAGDTDFRALCRKTRPDFVVALGRHCDMVDEATFLLEGGIPFALEKPCGMNARDAMQLAALEEHTGNFAAVPLVFRNGDFTARLRKMSAQGIQYMTYRFIAGFPARYQQANCHWMLNPALAGGGSTINLGIHFLDLAVLLMGAGVKGARGCDVQCRLGACDRGLRPGGARTWCRSLRDRDGVSLPGSHQHVRHALRRTYAGRISCVAHDPETVELVRKSGERQMIASHTTNVTHYRTFMRDVLDRVRAGRPPLAGLSDMVPIMRLVDDAYAKAGFPETAEGVKTLAGAC